MPKKSRSSDINACFEKKIIPYVDGGAPEAAEVLAHASMVFLQVGELVELPEAIAPFREKPLDEVVLMLHLDLVRGLAREDAAMRYVASLGRVDGIITVHHHLVTPARRQGFLSVVRLFLQDTRAIDRGLRVIENSQPDAIELLPSVAAVEVADRFHQLHIPRIAGGLIYNLNTVQRALDSGCRAASTSNRELWTFNTDRLPRP